MAPRQCDKCGEMVDEAKAFCPGCGHAFVREEKRQEASKFEKLDPTVQFGQTMYNQLLEDMGLNISAAPNPVEKRVEVLSPVNREAAPSKVAATGVVRPAVKMPEKKFEKPAAKSNLKWYILIGLAAVFFLPIAIVSSILFSLEIWTRIK